VSHRNVIDCLRYRRDPILANSYVESHILKALMWLSPMYNSGELREKLAVALA
jgi:hypothetical protein